MTERLWTPRPADPEEFLPPSPEELAEQAKANRIAQLVRAELEKREAHRLANAREAGDARKPVRRRLDEELALPDSEEEYSIKQLLTLGGNALFAGRYKVGKTTFNANLLKAWVDGVPFLGEFECSPPEDKPVVTIFNYEMSEGQFRRWLRRFSITNQHNIHVVHLRGISLPLGLPEIRKEVAGWLREANTGLWIVDPASRAMAGMGDGSDNKDVNEFTAVLDEIKTEAGVRDLVLNVHMSHSASQDKDAERALGAQAWSAWADALWHVTKDSDGLRWFHAYGRDVEVDKMLVRYDEETMNVELVDTNPDMIKRGRLEAAVLEVVRENPGASGRVIRDHVPARCGGARTAEITRVLDQLVKQGRISTRSGPKNAVLHHLEDAWEPREPLGNHSGTTRANP